MEAREQGCPAGGDSGIEGSRVTLSSLSTGMYAGWIIQAVCTARRRHCYRVLWHTEGFNPITLALHPVIIRTSEKNYRAAKTLTRHGFVWFYIPKSATVVSPRSNLSYKIATHGSIDRVFAVQYTHPSADFPSL